MKIFIKNYLSLIFLIIFFIILPTVSVGNFEDITLENLDKYLEIPENDVNSLMDTLRQVFVTQSILAWSSGEITDEEILVTGMLRKVITIQVLNHLFREVPLEFSQKIIKAAVTIIQVYIDPTVGWEKFEKLTVKKAIEEGKKYLFQKEIRITQGVIGFKYYSYKEKNREIFLQYIMIYKPQTEKRAQLTIRFYMPNSVEAPASEERGTITSLPLPSLQKNLPPFIVEINGLVEKDVFDNYKWVDEKGNLAHPNVKISFPEDVPDLGIKPLSFWEKYILKSIKTTIKDVEIIITKVTGKPLDLNSVWEKIKSSVSKVKSFLSATVFFPSEKEVVIEEILPDSPASSFLPSESTQKESPPELASPLVSTTIPKVQKPDSLDDLQDNLDDIAEKIDILSQEINNLVENFKLKENQVQNQNQNQTEEIKPIEKEIGEEKEEEINKEKKDLKRDNSGNNTCFIRSININTASKEELQKIVGVGEVLAQKIIEARPFYSINDLIRVSGIGEVTLKRIIDQNCAYVENRPVGGGGGSNQPQTSSTSTYPKILISEIQILPIGQRFIELYNPNSQPVDLTGWYIQRKTKTGSLWDSLVSSTKFKEKTIPSNGYFLVSREIENSDVLLDLTLSDDNSLVLKNPNREVVDKVGWGDAQEFETIATINPLIEKSIGRKWVNGSYQDTDNNYEDFESQTPSPKAKNIHSASFEPVLEVSLENLDFSITEFATSNQSQTFSINSSDGSNLTWQAVIEYVSPSDNNWLKIEPDSGVTPSDVYVLLSQDAFNLGRGNYKAEIVINSNETKEGSNKKLEVNLEVKAETEKEPEPEQPLLTVVINEIAWMGTRASSNDEWIELYNTTKEPIDLNGWTLKASDGTPQINLAGTIQDYFLLERTSDENISDINADQIYKGALGNQGEKLELRDVNGNLIDLVDCSGGKWFTGKASPDYISMERIDVTISGSNADNWVNNNPTISQNGLDANGNPIFGTPKTKNSAAFLGKVVYIDDDFQDDSANHYWNTIYEGIIDAQQDWMVIVKDGVYKENIKIEKPNLIIRSENGVEKTIIETAGLDKDIFKVLADNIEIKGFTFRNNNKYGNTAVSFGNVKNCNISDNKFLQNFRGISLLNSTENTLKNNIFEENRVGLYLDNSHNNFITKNIINSKFYSWHSASYGIYLYFSDKNIIEENTANDKGYSNATDHGITHGIYLVSSKENILKNNKSQNNKGMGNGIYMKDSDFNQLEDNLLTENQVGIELVGSKGNTLKNNKTKDNDIAGIKLWQGSSENVLKNNEMENNYSSNLLVLEPDLNNDIDETNTVDLKPVYYLQNKSDLTIDSSFNPGLIYCFNCQNITIKNLAITGNDHNQIGIYFYKTNNSLIENIEISENETAILLSESNDNIIKGSLIKKNGSGISLVSSKKNQILENTMEENGISLNNSEENEISNNLITNSPTGIELIVSSSYNTFFDNTLKENNRGISLYCSWQNLFYHNNFIDNNSNEWGSCVPYSPENNWYNSDLNQGNYYSNYDESEEGCNDSNSDNICDSDFLNGDKYPFLNKDGWKI